MGKKIFLLVSVLMLVFILGCSSKNVEQQEYELKLEEVDSVDIGMTKEEFFMKFSDSTEFNVNFDLVSSFPSDFDFGSDCWNINDLAFVCFKDEKVFVISGNNPHGGQTVRVHENRSSLMNSLDYTSFETCDNLDDLPYYVGYLDRLECIEHVTMISKNSKGCQLLIQERMTGGEESVIKTWSKFPIDKQYDDGCIKSLIMKGEDPALCEKIGPSIERHLCYRAAGLTTESSCFDTDGGKNYFEKGMTSGITEISDHKRDYKDGCSSPSQVIEYYCDDGYVKKVDEYGTYCPDGKTCDNGACV